VGHYHYDCDEYCDECLPVGENSSLVEYDMGEQDSPANCCQCHRPLDYSLTQEGVKYVLGHLKNCIKNGIDWNIYDCYVGSYYEGMPHCAVVRDWAFELKNYFLTEEEEEIVDKFLELTKEVGNWHNKTKTN